MTWMHTVRRVTVRTAVTATVVVGTVEWTTHLPSQGRSSALYHYVADQIITPLMRQYLDPEVAHTAALELCKYGLSPQHRPSAAEQRIQVRTRLWGGGSSTNTNIDKFVDNPIGLAAGFDKDAMIIPEMIRLGFGFVEIGTVTPQPQSGNPKPRMFRLPADQALINRCGFNSAGAVAVANNLRLFRLQQQQQQQSQQQNQQSSPHNPVPLWQQIWNFCYPPTPLRGLVGVNIGKNRDTTTSEGVVADYVSNITTLGPYADYIVINVSSPNTTGLRDWQDPTSLRTLLTACIQARNQVIVDQQQQQQQQQQVKVSAQQRMGSSVPETIDQSPSFILPLLVKVSPDLTNDELLQIADVCLDVGLDGMVVTNTTTQRPTDLLSWADRLDQVKQEGGLSGRPVRDRSTDMIRLLYRHTAGQMLIIGVGGITNGADAYEKLRAGASVVQVYSSLVYGGPGTVSRIRQELATIMTLHGQRDLQRDVVGSDHDDESEFDRNTMQDPTIAAMTTTTPTGSAVVSTNNDKDWFWKRRQAQLEEEWNQVSSDANKVNEDTEGVYLPQDFNADSDSDGNESTGRTVER